MLTLYDKLPDGLLQCEATELHRVLPGPSLILLDGRQAQPLFISLLLHGNEVTGWQAMRQILQKYQTAELPRSIALFVGNIHAAREGMRYLETQPDYNRIWKGEGEGPEAVMVRQVMELMREQRPFASIDLHNNSGRNPHYACINKLDRRFMYLASLFSRTVVYFVKPDSVQSMAFAEICPAVTIECGRPGEPHGVEHALQFIEACLHLQAFPEHDIAPQDIDLFHTVAIVRVPTHLSIGLEGEATDICIPAHLDQYNFSELQPGMVLGTLRQDELGTGLVATDEQGDDVSERFFELKNGQILTRLAVMPSMLSLDSTIIKQDCLCYLMERLDFSQAVGA